MKNIEKALKSLHSVKQNTQVSKEIQDILTMYSDEEIIRRMAIIKNKDKYDLRKDLDIFVYEKPENPPGIYNLDIVSKDNYKLEFECEGYIGLINSFLIWLEEDCE